jgi:AAA ATPase domain
MVKSGPPSIAAASSPYKPAGPATGAGFAGREEVLRGARNLIRSITEARDFRAMLIVGHRGSGKTSALLKIRDLVSTSPPGALFIRINLTEATGSAALLRGLLDEIADGLEVAGGTGQRWISALRTIRSVSVSIVGTGVTIDRNSTQAPTSPITAWKKCLRALKGIPLLCLCVDDGDHLDRTGLGLLKVLSEAGANLPILLLVTGGIEIKEQMRIMHASPVARIFSGYEYDVGEFTPEETRAALEGPLGGRSNPGAWTSDGIEEVHKLTLGYPFLVQCFAAAAYADGSRIGSKQVVDASPAALNMAASWCDGEIRGLSPGDVRAFARIARIQAPLLSTSEMVRNGVPRSYVRRLTDRGVLKLLYRGHYELVKAPAIAYYGLTKWKLI